MHSTWITDFKWHKRIQDLPFWSRWRMTLMQTTMLLIICLVYDGVDMQGWWWVLDLQFGETATTHCYRPRGA